jgi:hypothetical protein
MIAGMMLLALPALAQLEDPPAPPESALEQYLHDHQLRDLLALHLLRQLRAAEGPERAAIAENDGGVS